jgi:prepilin-type N-terminal cleavage/methylation domain-containing protein/prepilin-type processing-associated H-X9-DG protein
VKAGRYSTRAGCLNAAFTLIELLVVIAIIGILLAILIPSMKKAQDQVRTVICRTHLKGIGTAIMVYLDQNGGKSFDYGETWNPPPTPTGDPANGFLWNDPAKLGQYINPRTNAAYWGVAYVGYTDSPEVFGCPSYMQVKRMIDNLDVKLARQTGYGMNRYFSNLKVSEIRSTSQFIVAHDHVEPKVDIGGTYNDSFAIDKGQKINLSHYRPTTVGGAGGDRLDLYTNIFRHNKRSPGWDDPAKAVERAPIINSTPNGLANCLFLDGHAEGINETTGENVNLSWYTGKN